MPTPTMSLRALPEHHQLIRRMARALIERPELAESLTALIEGATQGVPQDATRPNPPVDQRIEDIERRLEQLEGQAVSHGEAPDVLPAIQPAIHDLLLTIQQRQLQQEETTRKVMAFAQSINGRVIEALGQPAKPKAATPPQHSAATQPPRSKTSSNRPIPPEVVEEAARLWDGGKGPSIPQIIAAKGWPHHRGALGKRVKRYLEQSSDQAEPASPVDENPAPPVEPPIESDPSGR
jgi:hypothetical protein